MLLFDGIQSGAERHPDRTAFHLGDARRTYAEMDETANRVANTLIDLGVAKGDRVALYGHKTLDLIGGLFGILKAGATAVTCNPLYTVPELHFQLKDTGTGLLFVLDHPGFYPAALEALEDTGVETVVICSVASHLPPEALAEAREQGAERELGAVVAEVLALARRRKA